MEDDKPPYWVLISVLFSTFPMSQAVALCLHEAAEDLYLRDASEGPLSGDLMTGKVRNLKKEFLIGTTGGLGFEAELETERGAGSVRFLLTRQALERADQRRAARASARGKKEYLH